MANTHSPDPLKVMEIEIAMLEAVLMSATQPVGAECCGDFAMTDHGIYGVERHCCQRPDSVEQTLEGLIADLNKWRDRLVTEYKSGCEAVANEVRPNEKDCADNEIADLRACLYDEQHGITATLRNDSHQALVDALEAIQTYFEREYGPGEKPYQAVIIAKAALELAKGKA
jgi:hypothetical protein